MAVYDLLANTGGSFSGAEAVLLGSLLLLVGLLYKSEAFERLVGSRVRGPLSLAFGTFGLPLMLLLMRTRGSRGGGIFRFLGVFVILVIIVIIAILALIAFIIYRALRRQRR